jgi:hypothetical protein
MDISAEKCETRDAPRPDFFSTVRQNVLGIIRRLAEFITVTEADRTKAGIYIRRDGA